MDDKTLVIMPGGKTFQVQDFLLATSGGIVVRNGTGQNLDDALANAAQHALKNMVACGIEPSIACKMLIDNVEQVVFCFLGKHGAIGDFMDTMADELARGFVE